MLGAVVRIYAHRFAVTTLGDVQKRTLRGAGTIYAQVQKQLSRLLRWNRLFKFVHFRREYQ